jgi:glycopeptide antibiotics resistance protein
MPSRKQRRRRQKDRRHEYEYVYVDQEGHELDIEDVPQPSRNGASEKAARRAALFAPFMFGILYLLNRSRDVPLYGVVFNTLVLVAFFIPFGYLMDRVMYRTYLRRIGGQPRK